MAPFNDVEIIFTSALTKQRLLKALESAIQTYESRKTKTENIRTEPHHAGRDRKLPLPPA